jgi:oligopeptide transport system permease protein
MATAQASVALQAARSRKTSFWWRFSRNRLAVVGAVIVAAFVIIAVFADLLAPAPYNRGRLTEARQFPGWSHWFGTDAVGRDYLSRNIYAARTSLAVGFGVVALTTTIGLILGGLAGFRGGWVDIAVLRLLEVATAIPALMVALLFMSFFSHSLGWVIIALAVVGWVAEARLTRAQFLAFREREFVTAARAIGASQRRIAFIHVLPNVLPILVVLAAFQIPTAIFAEAGLSFLGLGIDEPVPSWGKMVSTGLSYIKTQWYMALFPTIMVALVTLGFTFIGDGLRDALDPTMNR